MLGGEGDLPHDSLAQGGQAVSRLTRAAQPLAVPDPQGTARASRPMRLTHFGADEVHAKAKFGAITVIDVRDATEFGGQDNTVCCARRGHIPKAVWLEWSCACALKRSIRTDPAGQWPVAFSMASSRPAGPHA